MSFHRTEFFNHPEECDRMRAKLPALAPDFESFIVHGTLENPMQLDLYKSRLPTYNEHQIAIYLRSGDVFVKQT